jgi:roadblock/LC7 domain-containing protein
MSLPTEGDVGRALAFMAESDEEYAVLVGRVKATEHLMKVAKAQAFLDAQGTMAEKEARALVSIEYADATDEHHDAVIAKETILAKRKRAELMIEVWRSLNSARNKGNI